MGGGTQRGVEWAYTLENMHRSWLQWRTLEGEGLHQESVAFAPMHEGWRDST